VGPGTLVALLGTASRDVTGSWLTTLIVDLSDMSPFKTIREGSGSTQNVFGFDSSGGVGVILENIWQNNFILVFMNIKRGEMSIMPFAL
jgi:hypothetical protein